MVNITGEVEMETWVAQRSIKRRWCRKIPATRLLFSKNRTIFQSNGDLGVDPKDGEVLSQYAKLARELHRDRHMFLRFFFFFFF